MKFDYNSGEYSSELADRIFLKDLNDCLIFPKYIIIGTTDFCNAKCIMCPHSSERAEGHMMDEGLFQKILEEISSYKDWIESVSLYWYGEPFLDTQLIDRVAKMKKAGIKNIQISTNGACLDKETAEGILSAGLNDLRFSIDALKKETYEKIRYGLSYDRVIKNVLDVIELRNKKYPHVSIRIRLTEMEENLDEIEDFKLYWKERVSSIDKIQIMPLHTKENWKLEGMKDGNLEDYPCISLFSSMVIDTDGSVPLCCLDTDKKMIIGNIAKDSLKEVWNSKAMCDARMKQIEFGRRGISICQGCICWDRTFKTYNR